MAKRLYSPKREKLYKLIREARLAAGITQVGLAKTLGRHQSYVSDYERGHRRLDWVAVEDGSHCLRALPSGIREALPKALGKNLVGSSQSRGVVEFRHYA